MAFLNETGLAKVWDKIKTWVQNQGYLTKHQDISGKQDKETGKGLSTNDFTTTLKNKLDGIENNAQVNKIEKIRKNGTDLTITNKTVNIEVPTNNNQLINGAGYITSSGSITGNAATSTYAGSLQPCAIVGSDVANTSGWYKIASSTMKGFGNTNITYLIRAGYQNGFVGILEFEMRSDNTRISCWKCQWLTRMGFSAGDVIIVIDNMTWTMYARNPTPQHGRLYFIELQHRNINGSKPGYKVTYYNSSTPESSKPTATVTSSDGGICNYANSAEKATKDASGNAITTTYYKASNPSGYITNAVNNLTNYYLKTETYTKTEVNNLIGQIKTVSIEVVDTLPTTGDTNKIYFVPKTGETGDVYNEYIWINSGWELIGSTQVDLTGYAKTADLATVATTGDYNDLENKPTIPVAITVDSTLSSTSTNPVQNKVINTALNDKQGKLTAGVNITISDSTISAKDTTYEVATTSANGLMSSSDKTKLNGIATNANNYTLPIATKTVLGGVKAGENILIEEDGTINATGGAGGTVSDTLPIGSTVEWYSEVIPENWLLCNGQAISRTEYAELFAFLGTKFGDGDGSTTFNLPDKRKRFGLGKAGEEPYNELGAIGGETEHQLTVNEMPTKGVISYNSGETDAKWCLGEIKNYPAGTYKITSIDINKGAHNNMPPYIVVNYIIKAKQTAPVVSKVVDNLISTSTSDALSANQGRILDTKVSVSSAPPDTSNVAKLWVDTSGENLDLLYNNSESGDWESLLPLSQESSLIDITSQCSFVNCTLIGGKIYVDKVKKIVYIQVQIDITTTSAWGNVIYIPSDYKIQATIPAQGGAAITATSFWGYNTTNNVQIRGAITAGTNIGISGYYLMER